LKKKKECLLTLVLSFGLKPTQGDDDWQFVSLNDQQNFGIKTAGLEEKATACQMLVCYARELKEAFADYAEQVIALTKFHLNLSSLI